MSRSLPLFACLLLGTVTACIPGGAAHASDPFQAVLTQYSSNWTLDDGYQPSGAVWDPNASYDVAFTKIPSADKTYATSTNTQDDYTFFAANFKNALRDWAQNAMNSDLSGQTLISGMKSFLDTTFTNVKPQLAQRYPGFPDDVYRGLIIQNLIHGFFVYGTSSYYETITGALPGVYTVSVLQDGDLTVAEELKSLLQLRTADCGEFAELGRVMGRAWGLNVRYVGLQADFWSSIAMERASVGVHAMDILEYTAANGATNALLLDSITNMAIAPGPLASLLPSEMVGDGIIASASRASDRYQALFASGKVLSFFDWYMHPPVRAGYLKSGQFDASLLRFTMAYFLEAYPSASQSYIAGPAWQVNNAAYSVNQALY